MKYWIISSFFIIKVVYISSDTKKISQKRKGYFNGKYQDLYLPSENMVFYSSTY